MAEKKEKIRGLIVPVGLTPAACVWSIMEYQPEYILFIVSSASRSGLEEIRRLVREQGGELRYHDEAETPNEYHLELVYQFLEKRIPRWVEDHKLEPSEVLVDITGGTKAMAAALSLYTANYFSCFAYSAKREKDAKEEIFMGNPLEASIITHYKRWQSYAKAARYELIAEEIGSIVNKLLDHHKLSFCQITSEIYRALSAYDRFEKKEHFIPVFKSALAKLKNFQAGANNPNLTEWYNGLEVLGRHFERINNKETKDEEWIYALISNARRRAELEQKYEDAVARLYSALERIEQHLVFQKTGHKSSKFPLSSVPPELQNDFQKLPLEKEGDDKTIKIGLDKGMRLLDTLGEEIGREFCKKGNPWRGNNGLLIKRNFSILAHGFQPVSKADYDRWWTELHNLWKYDPKRLPVIPNLPDIWW